MYETDSDAIWLLILLYEADSDAIRFFILLYEADSDANLLYLKWGLAVYRSAGSIIPK